jgi:hypothetical protein
MTISNMRHVISRLAALVLLFAGVEQSRAGVLALEFASGGLSSIGGNASVGWSFTTNTAISITALDAWNVAGAAGSPVRLYNSGGTTLASATVLNTDPAIGAPTSFFSHAINPVPLAAGTYYIAEDIVISTPFQASVSGLTTNPAITYGAGVSAVGFGLKPTTDFFATPQNPGYFGPNFNFVTVPEPSTIALGIAGLAGFSLVAVRKKFRRV